MSGPNKVTAPIARSTAYDFNCHLSQSHTVDPRSRHGHDDAVLGKETSGEVLNVMPHEFLFEVVGGRQHNAARMKAKSSLNGVALDKAASDDMDRAAYMILGQGCKFSTRAGRQEMKTVLQNKVPGQLAAMNHALNRYIRYVGVAVTGIAGGPATAAQRQGFSATRGGLMTVMHRGEPIPAGSRVAMEFDITDILEADEGDIGMLHLADGVPRTKILPRLVRVHDKDEAVYDIKDAIAGIRKGYTVQPIGLFMPAAYTVARGGLPFSDLATPVAA